MPQRIIKFDYLRGLAIIGVLAIHTNWKFFKLSNYDCNLAINIFLREFFNFSVPLLVFLSGYFSDRGKYNTFPDYTKYLSKKSLKLIIPYIVFLFINWVFRFTDRSKYNLINIISFKVVDVYYFIGLVLQLYTITPVLQKYSQRKHLLISLCISLLSLFVIYSVRINLKLKLPLILNSGIFTTYLFFYHLGIIIKKKRLELNSGKMYILIFLIISFIEATITLIFTKSLSISMTAIKISSFVYSYFVIGLLLKSFQQGTYKFIAYLGKNSLFIYLSHILLVDYISYFISKLPLIRFNPILYHTVYLLTTIFFMYTITKSLDKVIKSNLKKIIFGISP